MGMGREGGRGREKILITISFSFDLTKEKTETNRIFTCIVRQRINPSF